MSFAQKTLIILILLSVSLKGQEIKKQITPEQMEQFLKLKEKLKNAVQQETFNQAFDNIKNDIQQKFYQKIVTQVFRKLLRQAKNNPSQIKQEIQDIFNDVQNKQTQDIDKTINSIVDSIRAESDSSQINDQANDLATLFFDSSKDIPKDVQIQRIEKMLMNLKNGGKYIEITEFLNKLKIPEMDNSMPQKKYDLPNFDTIKDMVREKTQEQHENDPAQMMSKALHLDPDQENKLMEKFQKSDYDVQKFMEYYRNDPETKNIVDHLKNSILDKPEEILKEREERQKREKKPVVFLLGGLFFSVLISCCLFKLVKRYQLNKSQSNLNSSTTFNSGNYVGVQMGGV